jgi:PAS domain S-box-containing protein
VINTGVKTHDHRTKKEEKVIIYNKKSENNFNSCDKMIDALQQQLNLVKTLLDATPTSFVFKDRKFVYRIVNSAFCRFLNKSEEEIIGKTDFDLFLPSAAELYRLDDEKVMQTGELLTQDEAVPGEHRNQWLQVAKIPIFEERGRCVGLVCTVHDITDRKQAEKALQESEEKFRLFFEEEPDYCYMISPEGRILDANKSALRILGYTKEEIVGKSLLEAVYAPSSREKAKALFLKWKHTGSLRNEELNICTKDGQERTVLLSVDSVRDAKGNMLHSVSVQRDITERKQVEEQIKASLREKEILLQEIHHRVKNNMQVISSLLNLQAEFIKDRKVLQILKDSQTRIHSMALVHEELYQSDDLTKINLDEYVRDVAAYVVQSYASNPGVVLTVDVEDITLGIDTAIPFGLIINELVSNCLKHAFPDGRKGEIEIQLRSCHDYVVLTVADNGVGMPEDFDFRNAQSLGLSLVTMLAEDQLNGDISLDRSGGTEVRITVKKVPGSGQG